MCALAHAFGPEDVRSAKVTCTYPSQNTNYSGWESPSEVHQVKRCRDKTTTKSILRYTELTYSLSMYREVIARPGVHTDPSYGNEHTRRGALLKFDTDHTMR